MLLRRGLALLCVLLGLFGIDRALGPAKDNSSEYGLLQTQLERLDSRPDASILVLGQSTTGRWLTPSVLGRILHVPARQVLDGHLSGCHPDCSFAEVRRLLAEGRHFKEVFFGVNLYTLCEGEPRRRVAAQIVSLPLQDTFDVMRQYWHATEPTQYYGSLVALALSEAYRDPEYSQRHLLKRWVNPKASPDTWIDERRVHRAGRLDRKAKTHQSNRTCSLQESAIAYKMSALNALIADLGKLADHAYVMALPDRSLTERTSPLQTQRWVRFVQLMKNAVAPQPKATFLDLATRGPKRNYHYRDAFHLSASGMQYQTRALKRQLRRTRR